MIKIIKGTYGYFNGRKVIPVTEADGPQSFSAEIEARLVKKGVAVYVDKEPQNNPGQATGEQPADAAQVLENDDELPAYDESMKLSELKEIAAAYGVDASKARSKAEVIAMIESAQGEDAVEDDGEEPPVFGAAMPE